MTKQREQMLKDRYEQDRALYRKTHRCPACGAVIDKHNPIRFRGWRAGVECDMCR